MRKLRLYLETSVWNFSFAADAPEKQDITKEFFVNVKQGQYEIFISQIVLNKIDKPDEHKRDQLIWLIKEHQPQELNVTQEVIDLSKEYIFQKVIPERKIEDALHVAVTTVYELDALITWNNRHIANLRKMEIINGVNLKEGYSKHIELVNPMEVISDEDR